jgi:hypothetical protein
MGRETSYMSYLMNFSAISLVLNSTMAQPFDRISPALNASNATRERTGLYNAKNSKNFESKLIINK